MWVSVTYFSSPYRWSCTRLSACLSVPMLHCCVTLQLFPLSDVAVSESPSVIAFTQQIRDHPFMSVQPVRYTHTVYRIHVMHHHHFVLCLNLCLYMLLCIILYCYCNFLFFCFVFLNLILKHLLETCCKLVRLLQKMHQIFVITVHDMVHFIQIKIQK